MSVRFRPCSSLVAASALRAAIDFRTHRFAIVTSSWIVAESRRAPASASAPGRSRRTPGRIGVGAGRPERTSAARAASSVGRRRVTSVSGSSMTSTLRILTLLPGSCCWKAKWPSVAGLVVVDELVEQLAVDRDLDVR